MHQTQLRPEKPLPTPVSLTSQSHHEKPLRSHAQDEGTQGFLPQPEKDLERPSSTRQKQKHTAFALTVQLYSNQKHSKMGSFDTFNKAGWKVLTFIIISDLDLKI